MLIFILSIILAFTGCVAQGAETSSDRSVSTTHKTSATKSTTSVEPTGTGNDNVDDQDGIQVHGTDQLPKPFDTSIGKTFVTTTCPAFFNLFLNDPNFINCLPLSAMLQNSNSFFEITKKSGFATTRVLDVACSVDYTKCASTMEYYGREIKTPERCGTEFSKQDQLVIQAYAAFISYPSLFKAGCLKSDTGSYCYVDAVTNVTSPDDPHIYFLPLGLRLPGGSRPTCSICAQETMSIFQEYAGNASLPLSETYVPAAQQLNIACGPEFVNTSVTRISNTASLPVQPSATSIITVTVLLFVAFFI